MQMEPLAVWRIAVDSSGTKGLEGSRRVNLIARGCFRAASDQRPRSEALKMNEVTRVGRSPLGYCPCVIVMRVTPVVLRNRHVAVGVHCLDVSNVAIGKPRDIAAPRSFVVRHRGE